jgi:signal transduction histidine kinase
LKNILNPLSIHLQLLARLVPKDNEDAHESLAEMRDVIQRGAQTIDRLRDFSRQTPVSQVAAADLDPLVMEAVHLARARIATPRAYHIAVRTVAGAPGKVRVQPSELISAVVNVVVNAIDAIADLGVGRDVTVTTGVRDDGSRFVSVHDDGPGMPPEIERRVFEPFFSTKGDAGTGLGLANVKWEAGNEDELRLIEKIMEKIG